MWRLRLTIVGTETQKILLTHSMQQSPSWEAERSSASQEIPHIFCSPKVHYRIHKCPAICTYPELYRSSPCPHIALPEDPSQYYPPIYVWVIQVVSFPQVSPPKLYTPLLSSARATCPAYLILLDFITRKMLIETQQLPMFSLRIAAYIQVDVNIMKVLIVAVKVQQCVPF